MLEMAINNVEVGRELDKVHIVTFSAMKSSKVSRKIGDGLPRFQLEVDW